MGKKETKRKPRQETEIISIPTTGRGAWAGAATYLTFLAYPSREDWPKRNRWFEAIVGWLSEYRGQRMSNREWDRVDARIQRGVDRIVKRRMVAARHARKMVFWTAWTAEPVHPLWKGRIPPVPTVGDLAKPLLSKRPAGFRSAEWRSKQGVPNVLSRIWKESHPVLHLMISLMNNPPGGMAEATAGGKTFTLEDLILIPSWVAPAVEQAEHLRAELSRYVKTFDASKAIRLQAAVRTKNATQKPPSLR